MYRIDWKKLRAYALVIALAISGTVALMPARPVAAQARSLPDFTDLVEQVGPSVVNIRTIEHARSSSSAAPGRHGRGNAGVLPPLFRPAPAGHAAADARGPNRPPAR